MQQDRTIRGKIGAERTVTRIKFYQFLVCINPNMIICISHYLIHLITVHTASLIITDQLILWRIIRIDSSVTSSQPQNPIGSNRQTREILVQFESTKFFIRRCLKQTVVLSTNPYQPFLILHDSHHMPHIGINLFNSFLTDIITAKSFVQAYPQDSVRVFIQFGHRSVRFHLPVQINKIHQIHLHTLTDHTINQSIQIFCHPNTVINTCSSHLSSVIQRQRNKLGKIRIDFHFILLQVI